MQGTIVTQIKGEKIPAVFSGKRQRPQTDARLWLLETGAAIAGTLCSDSLTKENGEAPGHIEMVRHNIRTIAGALANQRACLPA
jgi:zinc/manganese transport system substrate-binding protein